MKLNRINAIQLPTDQVFQKTREQPDDSPNDSVDTHDSSDYGHEFIPLNLSFTEKERVYILADWKLKALRNSQSDQMNVITSVDDKIKLQVMITGVLPFAGNRQEVFYLLLCLSKRTQKYVTKNQETLKPFFIEGQPLIERYLSGTKNCIQDYSRGIDARKKLGQLKYITQLAKDDTVVESRPRVVFDNETEYEGERDLAGRRHGKGAQFNHFGFLYEGQFKENKMHGYGRQIQPNGSYYVGKWNDHNRQGRGYQQFEDGAVYEGQWRNNRIHGMGKMTYTDGTYFDGQWKRGYRDGRGIVMDSEGMLRRGEWQLGTLKEWLSKPY